MGPLVAGERQTRDDVDESGARGDSGLRTLHDQGDSFRLQQGFRQMRERRCGLRQGAVRVGMWPTPPRALERRAERQVTSERQRGSDAREWPPAAHRPSCGMAARATGTARAPDRRTDISLTPRRTDPKLLIIHDKENRMRIDALRAVHLHTTIRDEYRICGQCVYRPLWRKRRIEL